jgi:aclacinomycin oxidase
MNVELTSEDFFAEVRPGDPLYRDLQLRGYNRRFVGTPDSVFVVDDTDQVVDAVDAAVVSGKKLAVRSGGHGVEGFVDDPTVQCVIDLSQMDSVGYDRHWRAFAVEAGATIGRVYQALDLGWGVTLPGGSCTGVGMGGLVTGGGFGPLTRLYGYLSDHLYAVETVVVDMTRATTRHCFCRSGRPATRWPRLCGVGPTSTRSISRRWSTATCAGVNRTTRLGARRHR